MTIDTQKQLEDSRMPLLSHMRELRIRLRNSLIGVLIGFFVAFLFHKELHALLVRPFGRVWSSMAAENPSFGDASLIATGLTGPFWTYFSLSMWAGVFLSSPLVFYQVWRFISPGMYNSERKFGVLFAMGSAICFVGGAMFCYTVVLEPIYGFLLGYASANLSSVTTLGFDYSVGSEMSIRYLPDIQEFTAFTRKLLIGFGLVFELPLAIFFLSVTGLITHRTLIRFNRWWIVLSFVIAALLTPPEIYSQILMAGPLIVLYNLSIGIAYIITKRREKKVEILS